MTKAFSRVKFMAAIRLTAKLKKNLTITRRNLERKKTQGKGIMCIFIKSFIEVSQMMMDK